MPNNPTPPAGFTLDPPKKAVVPTPPPGFTTDTGSTPGTQSTTPVSSSTPPSGRPVTQEDINNMYKGWSDKTTVSSPYSESSTAGGREYVDQPDTKSLNLSNLQIALSDKSVYGNTHKEPGSPASTSPTTLTVDPKIALNKVAEVNVENRYNFTMGASDVAVAAEQNLLSQNLKRLGERNPDGTLVMSPFDIIQLKDNLTKGIDNKRQYLTDRINKINESGESPFFDRLLGYDFFRTMSFGLLPSHHKSDDPEVPVLQKQLNELNQIKQSVIAHNFSVPLEETSPVIQANELNPGSVATMGTTNRVAYLRQLGSDIKNSDNLTLFTTSQGNKYTADNRPLEDILNERATIITNPETGEPKQIGPALKQSYIGLQEDTRTGYNIALSHVSSNLGKQKDLIDQYFGRKDEPNSPSTYNDKINAFKQSIGYQQLENKAINSTNSQDRIDYKAAFDKLKIYSDQLIAEGKPIIDKYSAILADYNALESDNNKYFHSLDQYHYDKGRLEAIAKKGFSWAVDVKTPVLGSFVGAATNTFKYLPEEVIPLVKNKLGIYTNEQTRLIENNLAQEKEFDYAFMQPDYLKDMKVIDLEQIMNRISKGKTDLDEAGVPKHMFNWRSLIYSMSQQSAGAAALMVTGPLAPEGLAVKWAAQALVEKEAGNLVKGWLLENAAWKLTHGAVMGAGIYPQVLPDQINEALSQSNKGQLAFDDILNKSLLGGSEVTLTEAAGLSFLSLKPIGPLKAGLTKEILGDLGGRKAYSYTTEAVKDMSKRAFSNAAGTAFKNPMEDLLRFGIDKYYASKNIDYEYKAPTIATLTEGFLNTAIGMFPYALHSAGFYRPSAWKPNDIITQAAYYQAALHPEEYLGHAIDYVDGLKDITKYFPQASTKAGLKADISQIYRNISLDYKMALPALSELHDENTKVSYFAAVSFLNRKEDRLLLGKDLTDKELEVYNKAQDYVDRINQFANLRKALRLEDPEKYRVDKFTPYLKNIGLQIQEFDPYTATESLADLSKMQDIQRVLQQNIPIFQSLKGGKSIAEEAQSQSDILTSKLSNVGKAKPEAPPVEKEPEEKIQAEKDRITQITDTDELLKEKKAALKNPDFKTEEQKEIYKHIINRIAEVEASKTAIQPEEWKESYQPNEYVWHDNKIWKVVAPDEKLSEDDPNPTGLKLAIWKADGSFGVTKTVSDQKDVSKSTKEERDDYFEKSRAVHTETGTATVPTEEVPTSLTPEQWKRAKSLALEAYTSGALAGKTEESAPGYRPAPDEPVGVYTLKFGDFSSGKYSSVEMYGPDGELYDPKVTREGVVQLISHKFSTIPAFKAIGAMSEEEKAWEAQDVSQQLLDIQGRFTTSNPPEVLEARLGKLTGADTGTPPPTEQPEVKISTRAVVTPLSTKPGQLTRDKDGNPILDTSDFMKTQVATLANLLAQFELGNSYEQQGYYLTVMNNTLPIDAQHQKEDVLADHAKKGTSDWITNGKIAVLTDRAGTVLYFNTNGERVTKGGFAVHQNLRLPTDKDKNGNQRFSGLDPNDPQLRALLALRGTTEPITMTIAKIEKEFLDAPTFQNPTLEDGTTIRIVGNLPVFTTNGHSIPAKSSPALQDSTVFKDIQAILDLTKTKGLPENFRKGFRAAKETGLLRLPEGLEQYVEQFIYTGPNGSYREGDKILKGNTNLRIGEDGTIRTVGGMPVESILINVQAGLIGSPVTYYRYDADQDEFVARERPYNEFIAKNYKVYEDRRGTNLYMDLGRRVAPETPKTPTKTEVVKSSDSVTGETPARQEFKAIKKKKLLTDEEKKTDLGNNTPLKRGKFLVVKSTPEQHAEAREWAAKYLKISGAEFQHLMTVVNSDAWGDYSNGLIRLFADSDFTTFYHEAFHDFTQNFLTKPQKEALYKEAANTPAGKKAIQEAVLKSPTGKLSYMEGLNVLEEALAEDFLKYRLGKKTAFNTPVENKLFRKIVDWRNKIFKLGAPSIDSIYQKLSGLQFSEFKRSKDNAFFGQLNSAVDGLSYKESLSLFKGLDGEVAKQARLNGLNIADLFKNPTELQSVYRKIRVDLDKAYDTKTDEYAEKLEAYNNASAEEAQKMTPELSALSTLIGRLEHAVTNWSEVVKAHLNESAYLKISKAFIPDELLDDLDFEGEDAVTKDSIYDDDETKSAKTMAANQLVYLIASLPKYEFKDGESQLKQNDYLSVLGDVTEFDRAWSVLARTLEGERSYPRMWEKIEGLIKYNPEYKDLLESLPNPTLDGASLTALQNQLRTQFWGTFSKPYVAIKIMNFFKNSAGQLKTTVREGLSTAVDKQKSDWADSIQEIPNDYRILDTGTGQYEIDTDKIVDSFKTMGKSRLKREAFLAALGFTFSPETKESPEYKDLVDSGFELNDIYDALKQYTQAKEGKSPHHSALTEAQKEGLKQPVGSIPDILDETLYGKDPAFFAQFGRRAEIVKGQMENIEKIANIELKYSPRYSSDNVHNSEGKSVYAIRPWNQITVMFSVLNDVSFRTYPELISDPLGSYYDFGKNPDADNIYLNAIFYPVTGKRRTTGFGKPAEIHLYNHNGWNIRVENEDGSVDNAGVKTIGLARFEKLVQDISPLLLHGAKEHLRTGDKTTANGTDVLFTRQLSTSSSRNLWLAVATSDFKGTHLPAEALAIFKKALNSALRLTNDYHVGGIGKTFDQFHQNLRDGEHWGFFDEMLSKETKDAILADGLLTTYISPSEMYKLITKHEKAIAKDIKAFMKEISDDDKTDLTSNPLLDPKDYISQELMYNPLFGDSEEERFETIMNSFSVNSFLMNMEHFRLMYQDPRFYKNKPDAITKKRTYQEAFKRLSKATSTGEAGLNDEQMNAFLDANPRIERQEYNKAHPDSQVPVTPATGVVNVAIAVGPKTHALDYISSLVDNLKDASAEELAAATKAYEDIDSADAAAFCTLDFWREWKIRTGDDHFNRESEAVYQDLARGKSPQGAFSEDFNFISPIKTRIAGFVFDQVTQRFIPFDLKQAIIPLIPYVVQGRSLGVIRENMIRQNTSIFAMDSASKHSAITNNGKHNEFYDSEGKPSTADYTHNPIHVENMFNVVTSPEEFKDQNTYSTQQRALLFGDLYEGGVSIDFSGEGWHGLSEVDKEAKSSIYRDEKSFGKFINQLVQYEADKLLKKVGAHTDSHGNFAIDPDKLSDVLEDEFNNRNLPDNARRSLEKVNGKFKFAFDASLYRNTVEQIFISIVDKKLRRQKVKGDSLIMSSAAGWEPANSDKGQNTINSHGLDFYKREGRTLPDGTKVTSAMKSRIPITGDFKYLLKLPDVLKLSRKSGSTPLEALNTLIKDEAWLDRSGVRDMITLTGDKIPVQGHNSMEFTEPTEFLSSLVGPLGVFAAGWVAKTGGDYDWDKNMARFPNIHYNPYTGAVKLYRAATSNGQADAKALKDAQAVNFDELTAVRDYGRDLKHIEKSITSLRYQIDLLSGIYQELTDGTLDEIMQKVYTSIVGEDVDFNQPEPIKEAIKATVDKIYANIDRAVVIKDRLTSGETPEGELVNVDITKEAKEIAYSQLEALGKVQGDISELIYRNSPKKAYDNELNILTRKTLERTELFNKLTSPNSTFIFKPTADDRRAILEKHTNSYSRIPAVQTNLDQFYSNTAGRKSLGIGAISNKFFSLLQRAGVTLQPRFIGSLDYKSERYTSIRLPHNKIKGLASVSGINSKLYKGTKYSIADSQNQLMNGWVDVAKDDWVAYINGVTEVAPKMLYALWLGIHPDVVTGFFNQPVITDYVKNLQNYKSALVRLKNPELYRKAKAMAIYDTIKKWLPEDAQIYTTKEQKERANAGDLLYKTLMVDQQMPFFYGLLNNGMRILANDNPDLFDPKYFMKFSVPFLSNPKDPKSKKILALPSTDENKLAQALYLIQYLEFEQQQNAIQNVRRTVNQDTTKPDNLQASENRQLSKDDILETGLITPEHLDRLANESTIKGFTNETTGIDAFLKKFSANTFEITNSDMFNQFLFDEFRKPENDITKYNYNTKENEIIKKGNDIPFANRFSDWSDWIRDAKSDFIQYQYQNYVYKPDSDQLVVRAVENMMRPDTALALELESIKRTYPDLAKNNLLINYLIRDNQKHEVGRKDYKVNLKLRKSRIDSSTKNVLTEAYDELYNSPDPILSQFAKNLGYFAFIQSGLTGSDLSFTDVIDQDVYGPVMTGIVKASKKLEVDHPEKAKAEIERFYKMFKVNNPKYYNKPKEVIDQMDPSRVVKDRPQKWEGKRGKSYYDPRAIDLLSKRQEIAQEKIKRAEEAIKEKTSKDTEPWTAETSSKNPKNFYVYELRESGKGVTGSSIVRGDELSPAPNTGSITTMEGPKKPWTDETLAKNIQLINTSLDILKANILRENPNKVLFPADFAAGLSNAPKTLAYLAQQVQEKFGLDTTPKLPNGLQDISAIGPLDGDKVETEKGAIGVNKQQLMMLLGSTMYNKPLAQVAVKELLQNSFDAAKTIQNLQGTGTTDIHIRINAKARTISIEDGGIGMTPDIVKNAFLSIGGSNKEGLSTGERSGGLGLAKVQFLMGSEKIRLWTTRDGITTRIEATNIQLYNDDFEIHTHEDPDAPNGSFVEVTIPKDYKTIEGATREIDFPTYRGWKTYDILTKPLVGNVNVKATFTDRYGDTAGEETIPIGVNSTTETLPPLFSNIQFSWGEADLYMSEEKVNTDEARPKHQILSSGIYQFNHSFDDFQRKIIPYNIVVNIKPSVVSTSDQYPFNNQREGFKNTVREDIGALGTYLAKFASGEAEKEAKDVFSDIKPLPQVDPNKILTSEEREKIYADTEKLIASNKKAREVEGRMSAADEAKMWKNISIGAGTITNNETGESVDEKSYGKSFKADKKLEDVAPVETAFFNPTFPQFHNNTSFNYLEVPGAIEFMTDFGNTVLQMVRFAGDELGYDYRKLATDATEKFFAGVSIDKSYGGVHIRKILNAIFVNPLAFNARTLEEAVGIALHVTIHEINHTTASGEGATFTTDLAILYGKIYSTGKYGLFEGLFRSVYRKHFETYQTLRNEYDKSNTRNLSRSFEGNEIKTGNSGSLQRNADDVQTGQTTGEGSEGDRVNTTGDKTGDVIASRLAKAGKVLSSASKGPSASKTSHPEGSEGHFLSEISAKKGAGQNYSSKNVAMINDRIKPYNNKNGTNYKIPWIQKGQADNHHFTEVHGGKRPPEASMEKAPDKPVPPTPELDLFSKMLSLSDKEINDKINDC